MTYQDHLAHFQDREAAIRAFDTLWDDANTTWALAFDGFSGHGKSTLINWLEAKRCIPQKLPYSIIGFENDAHRTSYKALLDGFFEHEGMLPYIPQEAHRTYRDKRDAILQDRDRRRLELSFTQNMESVSDGSQTISADLARAVRALERQARDRLTDAWLDCLAQVQVPRLVLFLDTYERYQDSAEKEDRDWLWETLRRAHTRLPGLRVVVGSREKVRGPERGLSEEPLNAFTREHSDALMQSLGVDDAAFRRAVFQRLAKGHPLVTRFAAEAWLATCDKGQALTAQDVPNVADLQAALEWVHGRILDRLEGPLKEVVRWGGAFAQLQRRGVDCRRPNHNAPFPGPIRPAHRLLFCGACPRADGLGLP